MSPSYIRLEPITVCLPDICRTYFALSSSPIRKRGV